MRPFHLQQVGHGENYKSPNAKQKFLVIQNNELRNRFGVQVWREIEKLQELHGMQVYRNSKGWWSHTLHKKSLQFHFGMNRNVPKILLFDDFS